MSNFQFAICLWHSQKRLWLDLPIGKSLPEDTEILQMDEFLKEGRIMRDKNKDKDRALNYISCWEIQEKIKPAKP